MATMTMIVSAVSVTVNYALAESLSPFADANLEIKVNGVPVEEVYSTSSGSITVPAGSIVSVEAYGELPSLGINPKLHLNIRKNSITFFDNIIDNTPPPNVSILTSFIPIGGAIYDIEVDATADAPSGSFGNVEVSQLFTRDNCASGYAGTTVEYTVDANTYMAADQITADGLAANDITVNGQSYANTNGSCVLQSLISTLLIDYYADTTADLCLYCHTAGVAEEDIIVTAPENNSGTGVARYPNDGRDPATCYLLSSNRMTGSVAMRFGVNMAYFISKYPGIDHFTFIMRGRGTSSGSIAGIYALRDVTQGHLIMPEISPGSGTYIPSVSGATPAGIVHYGSNISSGRNGTVAVGIGLPILQLDYIVSTNILTQITY